MHNLSVADLLSGASDRTVPTSSTEDTASTWGRLRGSARAPASRRPAASTTVRAGAAATAATAQLRGSITAASPTDVVRLNFTTLRTWSNDYVAVHAGAATEGVAASACCRSSPARASTLAARGRRAVGSPCSS